MAAARAPLIRPRAVAIERLHEASSGGHWTALYRDRAETGIEGGSAPEEQRRLRCCIHCLALQQNGPSPMNSILAPMPYRGDRSSGPMQSHSPLDGTWHRRMALGACAHRACKACAHRRRATARRNCPAPHRHTPPSPLRRRTVSSGVFFSYLPTAGKRCFAGLRQCYAGSRHADRSPACQAIVPRRVARNKCQTANPVTTAATP